MKKRNLVYLLAFIFTLTLGVTALADEPPGTPAKDTSLTLEVVEATAGNAFTVTAVLEDEDNNLMEGYSIEFAFGRDTDNDNVLEEVIDSGGTDTTDVDGYAEYTFTAPSDPSGDYDYWANFNGTDDYLASTKTETVNVATGAEVRAGNPSEEDHLCSRVKGGYSLNEIEGFTDPNLKGNRVYLYTLIHTLLPGWFS